MEDLPVRSSACAICANRWIREGCSDTSVPTAVAASTALVAPDTNGLRAFLARLPVDGPPVILVTHQVVVNAFTPATPPAGGGSVFQSNGTGAPKWLGPIPVEAREAL